MDQQKEVVSSASDAAEKLISGIQKDYKIVGTHRVHAWYAWAMVGIVFGMALGVVYVANRSGEFAASQAAGLKITVSSTGGTGYIHKVGVRNNSFIADAGAIPTTIGQTITTGPGLDFSFAGTNVRTIYNFDEEAISAVFVSSDRSKASLGARSGQRINISPAPSMVTVDGNKKTDFVFKGVYINSKNQKKTGTINGTLTAGIDILGTYSMEGSGRTRTVVGETPITVPRGMPLYTNTPISITLDGSTRKFTDKTLLLPSQRWSGTWTLTFRDKDTKGLSDGNVEIVKTEFDPTPTLLVETHGNTLPAQILKPGLKKNRVLTILLSTQNGKTKINKLSFRDTITGTPSTAKQSFTNFYLYDGATKITGPIEAGADNSITFNLLSPLLMPEQGIQQSMVLTLYADVATDAISGSQHTFSVNPTDISIESKTTLIEGSATGNTMTIGTAPALPRCADGIDNDQDHLIDTADPGCSGSTDDDESNPALGPTSAKGNGILLSTTNGGLTIISDTTPTSTPPDTNLVIKSVTLQLYGQGIPGTTAGGQFSAILKDEMTGATWGASTEQTCTRTTSANYCEVTFDMTSAGSSGYVISGGSSKRIRVQVNGGYATLPANGITYYLSSAPTAQLTGPGTSLSIR